MKFCFISAMFEFFNLFLSTFYTLLDLGIGVKIRIRHADQIDNLFLRVTDEHTMQDQFQPCMVICAVNATVEYRNPWLYKPLSLTETDMALFNVKFFCKFRNGKIAVCITHGITNIHPILECQISISRSGNVTQMLKTRVSACFQNLAPITSRDFTEFTVSAGSYAA